LPDGRKVSLSDAPLLTSADVTGANASLTEGRHVLNVDLTSEGARRIQRFSEQNVGRTLASVVDGQVLRMPKIQDPIIAKGILIGGFPQAEAERLANAFSLGCRQ
jgi:preprotein translocase subunit SecD